MMMGRIALDTWNKNVVFGDFQSKLIFQHWTTEHVTMREDTSIDSMTDRLLLSTHCCRLTRTLKVYVWLGSNAIQLQTVSSENIVCCIFIAQQRHKTIKNVQDGEIGSKMREKEIERESEIDVYHCRWTAYALNWARTTDREPKCNVYIF